MKNNCDCINIEVGSFDNQVEITHPNLSHPIMVDKCIAEEIKELLNEGIKTLGSCCGHNKTIPSIMVAQESVKLMEQRGYIHCFNPMLPIGYGSDLMFFPKSVKHEGFDLLEWKCIPQPLFTLTPEEVEELKEFLEEEIQALDLSVQFLMTTDDFESCEHNSKAIEKRNQWLNRIKEWKGSKI